MMIDLMIGKKGFFEYIKNSIIMKALGFIKKKMTFYSNEKD
jgi:hypothetical protein